MAGGRNDRNKYFTENFGQNFSIPGESKGGEIFGLSSNIKAFGAVPPPNSVSILIPSAFVGLFAGCLQYWLKAFLPQSVFGDCAQKDDGTPPPAGIHPPTIRIGEHTVERQTQTQKRQTQINKMQRHHQPGTNHPPSALGNTQIW